MSEIERSDMTAEEARSCVDRIHDRIDHVRVLILELYQRQGWRALGYNSWRACVANEFGQSESYLYYQLRAAMIELDLDPGPTVGAIPEKILRPLNKLDTPEARRAAWEEAKATAPNGQPTAKHVASIVEEFRITIVEPSLPELSGDALWEVLERNDGPEADPDEGEEEETPSPPTPRRSPPPPIMLGEKPAFPPEADKPRSTAIWDKNLYDLSTVVITIREHGGIAGTTHLWTPSQKMMVLNQLRSFQGNLESWIRYLEEAFS